MNKIPKNKDEETRGTSDPDTQAALAPSLPSRPAVPVPAGTCDTHVHVFDPARFAYAADRRYTPPPATHGQLGQVLARLGAERVVVIQPSCYGTDNAAMLDALRHLGPARARGVAVLDGAPSHDLAQRIDVLHRAGVRGVRLNASVNDLGDADAIAAQLARWQSATAHLGWHVQMYLPASTVRVMADVISDLHLPVVLDHFGGLDASSMGPVSASPLAPASASALASAGASTLASPEVDTLLRLLESGHVYLKLSAPYRVAGAGAANHDAVSRDSVSLGAASREADSRHGVSQALGNVVRQFAQAAPDRLLWGSDWPHTGGAGRRGPGGVAAPGGIEPFRSEDAASALDDLMTWLPDPDVRRRILVTNPERLYGFAGNAAFSSPSSPVEV
jgi:predicted TIM-barrel fold metal-dependent hydrolase